jgi:arsenate reductase (thioredoxin)
MLKVLFVCVHNSARSQMAEELLRKKLGDKVRVESAGLEPGVINPVVVDVLKTKGIDITGKKTKNVFDLLKQGSVFNYVITVCDETSGERCPIFPGALKRLHWSFPDPNAFEGSYIEKFEKTKDVLKAVEIMIDKFSLELMKNT